MCHYCLRQMPQALDHVQQALRLDPMYKPARVMLLEIAGEMRDVARNRTVQRQRNWRPCC
jgi:hypothetical protein